MQFNLKSHLEKRAAAGQLDKTTEGQLANDGKKEPRVTTNAQLEKSRKGEPEVIAEAQLDKARPKKDAPSQVTEAQLDGKEKAPNATTEKQLKNNQVGGSTAPVEKRLDGVRTASDNGHDCRCDCGALCPCDDADCNATSTHEGTCPECLARDREGKRATFNLSTFLAKAAAKKDKADQITEKQLGERGKDEPKVLTDAQLDKGRKDTKPVTTQALLEKARTGEADKLVEARLDESDSKLVKHRNPDASKGDMNKLEEQRLKAKKTAEGEKYEAASETDKDLMLPKVNGKDGLKTASGGWWKTVIAQTAPPAQPVTANPVVDANAAEAADEAVESPAEETEGPMRIDGSQDVTVGTTRMKQITMAYDPMSAGNEAAVRGAASDLLLSTYPALRAKAEQGGLDVIKSVTVMPSESKAVAMLPAELFAS